MKKLIALTTAFFLATVLTAIPGEADAQYVSNEAFCLSIDSSNNTSSMAFMENRCSYGVTVKYCFGVGNCETRPGATAVPARDKKTVYREHRKYPHRQLIAFACRDNVDFTDCQRAKEEFFRTRFRQ